ncbi:hypothetical protein A5320_02550 [Rheinheimera sp. SA_1]|uniref:hypothetical protein n=1 Tax=Rheinheimera sp. SA_1 TaxID=1827365 RepID=UPI000800E5EC|nr:hypothetical protein [Rheinheimera sp. SA_1]OBP16307.1 hypothetical protein A5320_02550 [Rheinheimera sp. SA_1]
MLKLTFRQQLRMLLWRHRRGVIFSLVSLLAVLLTSWGNHSLLTTAAPLLTLVQLAAGSLIVMLVILLSD